VRDAHPLIASGFFAGDPRFEPTAFLPHALSVMLNTRSNPNQYTI